MSLIGLLTATEKQVHLGQLPYEAHTVAPEEQLEGTRVTRKGDPHTQITSPPSENVAGRKQCASRSTITPTKTCSADLYRHIKKGGGGCLLKRMHCKGNLVPSRKQSTHQLSGTKGCLSGPKTVSGPLFEQHSCHSHRQHHSGCLHKQGWGRKSGPLCALLWRILTWCTSRQVTLKAQHIPSRLNVWLLEPQLSRSRASLRHWQHKLWLLKEDQPNQSMRQIGTFLQSGASVIRWTSGLHL